MPPAIRSFYGGASGGQLTDCWHQMSSYDKQLMIYDTQYNLRGIEYTEHNYSSVASSLWAWPATYSPVGGAWEGCRGAHGWLNKPGPWRGRCRDGSSNTGGPPLPRKRVPYNVEKSGQKSSQRLSISDTFVPTISMTKGQAIVRVVAVVLIEVVCIYAFIAVVGRVA